MLTVWPPEPLPPQARLNMKTRGATHPGHLKAFDPSPVSSDSPAKAQEPSLTADESQFRIMSFPHVTVAWRSVHFGKKSSLVKTRHGQESAKVYCEWYPILPESTASMCGLDEKASMQTLPGLKPRYQTRFGNSLTPSELQDEALLIARAIPANLGLADEPRNQERQVSAGPGRGEWGFAR